MSDQNSMNPPASSGGPKFETGEAWVRGTADQIGMNLVERYGHQALFEKARKIGGFDKVRAAWLDAYVRQMGQSKRGKEFLKIDFRSPEGWKPAFFAQLGANPKAALVKNQRLVMLMAGAGDVEFFVEVAKRIKASKRMPTHLSFHMVQHWLHGFLWMMSDCWGSSYLGRRLEIQCEESAYTKARQRLKLPTWESIHPKPLIMSFTTELKFKFEEGWTHLE